MKLKGKMLMVDFETLGTRENSVLLSCGMVLFDQEKVLREGYTEFDVASQKDMKRKIMQSTVDWWKKTDNNEYIRLVYQDGMNLDDWVKRTRKSLWETKPRVVWTRGSMDFLILSNLFGEKTMPFWKHRDVRTLDEFGFKQKDNPHNALEDCLNQIEYVQHVFNNLQRE